MIYNYIKHIDDITIFAFFIACDALIGVLLYRIKKNDKDNTSCTSHFILGLYMYNPVSIASCVSFRIDIVYTLFNLLFVYSAFNYLVAPIFLVISLVASPGYFFITIAYIGYLIISNFKQIRLTLLLSAMLIAIYFNVASLMGLSPVENIKNIYYNYFFIKDTLPNFSDLWSLLSGTFLKYQTFTLQMLLVYQFTLCNAVMILVYRIADKDYKYKTNLAYAMIFLMSHILDRYPCENHYIISLILLFQHWDVVKEKIMNLAVYCSVAGYTLIVCRGFPYTWRKTGTSNYLYFQNVTYEIAMTFVMMCAINGVDTFRKEHKEKKEKIN